MVTAIYSHPFNQQTGLNLKVVLKLLDTYSNYIENISGVT